MIDRIQELSRKIAVQFSPDRTISLFYPSIFNSKLICRTLIEGF